MPSSSEELIKAKTLLGLSDRTTLAEIKHQYKQLMKKWHPDMHPDNPDKAKEMSILINNAYEQIIHFTKHYMLDLSESSIRSQAQTPAQWWEDRFGFK
jgi:DnaJ-class molecular chaperone